MKIHSDQKGFAHIGVILLLLAGLAASVYLVQQKTNIFPKAAAPPPIPLPYSCDPCKLDINGDGVVDILDFSRFRACLGKRIDQTDSSGRSCASADITGDGIVEANDPYCIKWQLGKRCESSTPTPIPTPTPTPIPTPGGPAWSSCITDTAITCDNYCVSIGKVSVYAGCDGGNLCIMGYYTSTNCTYDNNSSPWCGYSGQTLDPTRSIQSVKCCCQSH